MNLTGAFFFFAFLEILGHEQDLTALGLGIQHGDADDLRRERPQAHELGDFFALGLLGDGVGDFLRLAEKVFLLRLVKVVERQRGSLNVKNERGHDSNYFVGSMILPRNKMLPLAVVSNQKDKRMIHNETVIYAHCRPTVENVIAVASVPDSFTSTSA